MQQLESRESEGSGGPPAAARLLRDGPIVLPVRRDRPVLIMAAGIDLVVALSEGLFWGPFASMLGQARPPRVGRVVAACTIPAILVADAAFRRAIRGRLDPAHPEVTR